MGRLISATFVIVLALAGAPSLWSYSLRATSPGASPVMGPLRSLTPQGSDSHLRSRLLERLHAPVVGPENPLPSSNTAKADLLCLECALAVSTLQAELAAGVPYDILVQEAIAVCVSTVGMSQVYCEGYIPLVAVFKKTLRPYTLPLHLELLPVVYHILSTNDIAASDVCGEILTNSGCRTTDPARDWSITIHGDKPPVVPILPPEDDAPRMKVLHLADTHMDPLYSPGANAVCPETLCCRLDSGVAASEEDKAWYWGDYRYCGSPPWMLEDMLTHARTAHPEVEYVVWTGDVVPHNMWSTSREWNLQLVRETYQMIRNFFPDVPVFPVVGNHEMSPLDQFPDPDDAPVELSADWLYEELAEQWSRLVPQLDNSTVRKSAYYSVLVRPGFRVISFNTMFGYSSNLWLVENSQDLGEGLVWLEAELGKAEAAGELVHLLGHVPPGLMESERTWSREYNRIVVRYENTIRGQFFGHTHYDEFEVFHDGDRPVNVAYISPSQTPWYGLNPAYRVYHIDGDRPETTRMVLDHETYVMNLTEAQQTGSARWYQLYGAREQYGMASLTPADWQDLAERMATDRSLFDLYYSNFVSVGDPYMEVGCDDLCYEQRLCDVVTSSRNEIDHCSAILRRKRRQ